ncbi:MULTISPECIES: extracellular solute-binding protein [unclassified Oceanispirochaeta]|uniref:extracellular solute-binding protein n=1 Tax=unclassified Oceanispirochaeta TaxID=2635722 RepID=UPI000E09CA25|nr:MULTISPECIES: extracellular solute-binding protein [unclassified Oceanispirochaeta]MBF9015854.1 extracellular solute-binding protein [Oceanispirochaeta sp. M2]NPD72317.1 extracellular solute-binding protein [Oceanispirochaeta sp. M1]RDG32088.1 extracellular solute-binding protein [Oceanispirochaeta sp. M1]
MKKILITLLVLLSAGMMFANGAGDEGTSAKKVVKIAFKEPGGSEAMTKWMTAAKAEFEATYPDVTVELSANLSNEADYNTKTALILQSDDSIDVVHVDSFLVPALAAPGYLAAIPTEEWAEYNDQFAGNVKEGMKIDGKTYAVSFSTDTRGLYYNRTVFKKAGVALPFEPKDWSDILDAVQKLHNAGIAYPIWMNGAKAQGEGTTMQTFEMLISGTDDWIIDGDKWVAKADGITASLKFIQNLYDMGIYDNNELATMLDAQSWMVLNEKMPQGQEVGILLDGNWKGGDFKGYEDSIGVTPMPRAAGDGFTSMSGGWTLGISSLSKNKDLAMDFIKIACNKENMLIYVNTSGDMTTRRDVAVEKAYIEGGQFRADMTPFAEYTHFRPGKELYPSISIEIQSAVESVITGQMSAEEAAESYATNVKDLSDEGNWIEK